MLLLLSAKTFSQKSFIVTNDNTKIIVDDNFFDIQIADERIVYKIPNNDKKEVIKFKNINTSIVGKYNMKRMKLADEKHDELYFTLADLKGKKMTGYNKIITTANTGPNLDHGGGTVVKFICYILDENDKALEKMETSSLSGEKYEKIRKTTEDKITKYFSDCKEVMDRLNNGLVKRQDNTKYSKSAGKMLDRLASVMSNIDEFFSTPTYSNCDEPKPENLSTKKDVEAPVSIADQKYSFGKISTTPMGSNGTKMTDYSFKGTIIIKDNSISFITKYAETKYKIISYQDGIIKCDDNGKMHAVTITSEAGKKGSFAYDTKITFLLDKEMGGSTSYYWCNKE